MSDFSKVTIVKARKLHRCTECHGAIRGGDRYERAFIVYEGHCGIYKTCMHCKSTRDWLISDTDWPSDVDGEGSTFYYMMLREHLVEQAREGDGRFRFKACRHIVMMDKRHKVYQQEMQS